MESNNGPVDYERTWSVIQLRYDTHGIHESPLTPASILELAEEYINEPRFLSMYARACTTPTLFIHSDEDYRCPMAEGLQMYTALVDLGVESKLVYFKGENHELSRSGKPLHRMRRLNEITDWMQSHLK